MHSFFSKIDTSKPYLLLGDTNHEKPEIQMFAYTKEFFAEANAAGYKKILTEFSASNADKCQTLVAMIRSAYGEDYSPKNIETAIDIITKKGNVSQKETAFLKAICFADYYNMRMVPVDPRSEEDKTHLIMLALQDAARIINGEKSTGGLNSAHGLADSKDDELLEAIKREGRDSKVIVLYGAGHFRLGTAVECGIPESERVIVNLHASEADDDSPHDAKKDAPDVLNYSVSSGRFMASKGRDAAATHGVKATELVA